MLDDREHAGGVTSLTAPGAVVQEPVMVKVEGTATALSLDDAKALCAGLVDAIARVDAHEASIRGGGNEYNLMVLGKSGAPMSLLPRSRLG